MIIGIDASRAFQKNRTGIEGYSYQVIKSLTRLDSRRPLVDARRVILYIKRSQEATVKSQNLPKGWSYKVINLPYLWTHIGLSLELLFHPVDVLFIPAHIVPIIHPENTIVTVHGLEYEFCPKAYSFLARLYMRWAIKRSCRVAKKIIAVSENTKKDLVNLYKIPREKIEVVYEGYDNNQETKNNNQTNYKLQTTNYKPYLLFVGRLEERKNICGIIEAFEILKEKYKISHKLILAGGKGNNYKNIKSAVHSSQFMNEIIETGFVSEEEKWELLKNADVFLFPTFYEGFGLPILEAQSAGVLVVAGNNSSIPEVANNSALLVNSKNVEQIAEATYKLISDKSLRDDIIKKGYENVKRFSWKKCAEEIAKLLNG